jgi:hypothetical protein
LLENAVKVAACELVAASASAANVTSLVIIANSPVA